MGRLTSYSVSTVTGRELLVKYNSMFARHRFDIGMNTDFKVKLAPQQEEPVSLLRQT